MAIDPREYIENDKTLPVSLSGNGGKVLAVNVGETGYEHISQSGVLTGQIIMWPLDAPPAGFLLCNGAAIDSGYTDLIALVGANTPNITFAKNSFGTNTGDAEAESIGTHGHTAVDHGHDLTVSAQANHTHEVPFQSGTSSGLVIERSTTGSPAGNTETTTPAGAHNHGSSTADSTAVTINDHSGTNQPACTLINFCIRT